MSVMSDLDLTLQTIREMIEPTPTERAQIFIERTVSSIINDLDQLCAFAADPSTVTFIEAEKIGIGMAATRMQLLQSLLLARQSPNLKMVGRCN